MTHTPYASSKKDRPRQHLIGEFRELREKLETDGDGIRSNIAEHAELNQRVMQLTTIISDSVKNLPRAPVIGR